MATPSAPPIPLKDEKLTTHEPGGRSKAIEESNRRSPSTITQVTVASIPTQSPTIKRPAASIRR